MIDVLYVIWFVNFNSFWLVCVDTRNAVNFCTEWKLWTFLLFHSYKCQKNIHDNKDIFCKENHTEYVIIEHSYETCLPDDEWLANKAQGKIIIISRSGEGGIIQTSSWLSSVDEWCLRITKYYDWSVTIKLGKMSFYIARMIIFFNS